MHVLKYVVDWLVAVAACLTLVEASAGRVMGVDAFGTVGAGCGRDGVVF